MTENVFKLAHENTEARAVDMEKGRILIKQIEKHLEKIVKIKNLYDSLFVQKTSRKNKIKTSQRNNKIENYCNPPLQQSYMPHDGASEIFSDCI